MAKKFITEFLPNLTSGELASVQSDLEIKNAAETLTAVESESGRDMSVDGAKLDGIEAGATADQTDAEILTAVESESGRDMSVDGAKLDTLDKINPIADKATAYALTGVVAGTVYETADTGQIMEYLGDALPDYSGFTLAGLSAVDEDGKFYNGTYLFRGLIDGAPTFRCDDAENAAGVPQGFAQDFWFDGSTWQAGAWSSTSGLMDRGNSGQEGQQNNYPHPASDFGGGYNDGFYNNNGTGADVLQTDFTLTDPESNPYNWKINGVVSVFDNDDKLLLTNLPDTQQVEVKGEGGRIERFNGDGDAQGLNNGDFKILVNHPDNPVINSHRINGVYTWQGSYYENAANTILGDSGGGTFIFYTGSPEWQSSTALSASPDLVSTWTAVSTAAQGYAAMTSDMVTQIPESIESNWSDIIGSFEVLIDVDYVMGMGAPTFDGVTYPIGAPVVVGWYQAIPVDFTQTISVSLELMEIDGVGVGANSTARSTYIKQPTNYLGGQMQLPVLPKVRSIQIRMWD